MDPQPISYATPARKGDEVPFALTSAAIGWRTVAGAVWLVGFLAAVGFAMTSLSDQQRTLALLAADLPPFAGGTALPLASIPYTGGGPLAFAVGVGAVAAVVLYDWSTLRLTWVAALPLVAGGWPAIELAMGSTRATVPTLCVSILVQAGLIYTGTHLGRPLARWLTRQLVPPPLRASLIALWI